MDAGAVIYENIKKNLRMRDECEREQLAGCGTLGTSNPSEAANNSSSPAPDAYEFTLDTSWGERSPYRQVPHRQVRRRRERIGCGGGGVDESGRALFEHGFEDDVPTLSELIDQAATAQAKQADVVEVEGTDEGRPTAIGIDWDSNATDDETCYRITANSTKTESISDSGRVRIAQDVALCLTMHNGGSAHVGADQLAGRVDLLVLRRP